MRLERGHRLGSKRTVARETHVLLLAVPQDALEELAGVRKHRGGLGKDADLLVRARDRLGGRRVLAAERRAHLGVQLASTCVLGLRVGAQHAALRLERVGRVPVRVAGACE